VIILALLGLNLQRQTKWYRHRKCSS